MKFVFLPDWAETAFKFEIIYVNDGLASVRETVTDPVTGEIWYETHTCQIMTNSTSEYVTIKNYFCLRAEDAEEEADRGRYSSSTNRDYGPSNPWDAPGMSINDFI